ncbi:hypothetical protein HP15_4071 [Marinobacter adhaerens HP15]|uniref:Uncharacterized protein n=1 Tax=Marinobacter adhaerens (strain DSM 23420 / HP15) TaxID=225937 RepID=E4PLP8_MARAH|nr:hypothetical protein HP15_4071 [Marinobacter adhaerens HP15]
MGGEAQKRLISRLSSPHLFSVLGYNQLSSPDNAGSLS